MFIVTKLFNIITSPGSRVSWEITNRLFVEWICLQSSSIVFLIETLYGILISRELEVVSSNIT